MTIEEKLARARSDESVDFSKYQSSDQKDSLVRVESAERLLVEPCWTLDNDWEGQRYRDYMSLHPEYDAVYLRSELAKRLIVAANHLDSRYKLVLRAGHRPIDVQRKILIDCADDYKKDNPQVSDEEALEHAREFVSDPETTLPPHVCGAAVDVDMIDTTTGKLVDFGSKLNDDTEKSYLFCEELTDTQKSNRLILLTAMLQAGLASCMVEWWHYSYGDQLWAWFYGKENSLYSLIDLDPMHS